MDRYRYCMIMLVIAALSFLWIGSSCADEEQTKNILKQGLLGAGVGAISAEASGGKAGQGALIGAGTGILGNALLDAVTGSSSSKKRRRPQYEDDYYYYPDEPEDYYYEEPPRESSTQKVLKQGLLGAGVGAISAGASGGKAGKGALIGAGTSVLGSALLDTITEAPSQRRGRRYRKMPQRKRTYSEESEETQEGTRKKVIKKYDESGKLVSEEEIYY